MSFYYLNLLPRLKISSLQTDHAFSLILTNLLHRTTIIQIATTINIQTDIKIDQLEERTTNNEYTYYKTNDNSCN